MKNRKGLIIGLIALSSLGNLNSFAQQQKHEHLLTSKTDVHALDDMWQLSPATKKKTFSLSPYKPIYIIPIKYTNRPNDKPISFSGHMGIPDPLEYQKIEARMQISFKTKIFEDVFAGKGDLWFGFTQTSDWQLFNNDISRPFRDLNYEPELIFNYPVNWQVNNFRFRMVGLAVNHNSNGQSNPNSRGWNRIIFHVGMESNNWSFMLRPWIRFPENGKYDDNAQITDYYGHGDFTATYTKNKQVLSIMLRSNMRLNHNYRGFQEIRYAYPIKNNLKVFGVINNGYGETLLDYNWNQSTIGIGVAFFDWN